MPILHEQNNPHKKFRFRPTTAKPHKPQSMVMTLIEEDLPRAVQISIHPRGMQITTPPL